MALLHAGIDDTDSKRGMCTTYVGAVALRRLEGLAEPVGYPKLIRLNPNCPYKTRGNCSIGFTVRTEAPQRVKQTVLRTVEELSEKEEGTEPGVAFLEGEVPPLLREFSKKVVREMVELEEAEGLAREIGAEVHKFGGGRGIIGALAAIGHPLEDFTYELLTYRRREWWGRPRRVDPGSVWEADRRTFPRTFDNLDPTTGEIRITPHTPCPVLYGIRGVSPEAVLEAHQLVKSLEPVDFYIIFKTNQATDEHLIKVRRLSEIRPLMSVIAEGRVSREPRVIAGGHVIFGLTDGESEVDCAAYEPTRGFRRIVLSLKVGDRVRVFGAAKQREGLPLTVNLEKLEVLELAKVYRKLNPVCACGKRMKSEGKGKGYSCPKCGRRAGPGSERLVEVERELAPGLYEVPPRARRHLSMPLARVY
ncbi:MAG: tRNA(Ile)(2)-agmatinylcytidine synthase [Candidatus Hadarchaeales archaeon]